MDRVDALRVFVAVAEEESFAAAARRLRLSPPAVTRAIAACERELGAPLLSRTTRVVRLTDTGARFLVDARAWLGAWEDMASRATDGAAAPSGRLSVTASVMFGRLYVAPVVVDYLAANPRVSVHALFVDRLVNLLEEGVDVAVRIAPLQDSSLHAVRVGQIRRVVVASPAYLAKGARLRTPADVEHHAVITSSPDGVDDGWRFRRGRAGRTRQLTLAPRLVANNADLAIAAAIAGYGLTRVLAYQAAEALRAGLLKIVLGPHELPPVPVHVVHAGGRHPPARVKAFRDLAVERLRAAMLDVG